MRSLTLFLGLFASVLFADCPPVTAKPLFFSMTEGRDLHRLYCHEGVQTHLVLEAGPPARLVIAFPAGNSGIAFLPGNLGRETEMAPLSWGAPPTTVTDPELGRGIRFGIRLPIPGFRIRQVLLESIRFLRDLPYPDAIAERLGCRLTWLGYAGIPSPGFFLPESRLMSREGRRVIRFTRNEPEVRWRYVFDVGFPPGFEADLKPEGWEIRPQEGNSPDELELEISAWVNFPGLEGFPPDRLFRPQAQRWLEKASNPKETGAERVAEAANGLRFLVTRDKILAGSWRYLTYFGRDTLLSICLLQDFIAPDVFEAGLKAVLDRLSPDGQVAHEEDIGGQAVHRHLARLVSPGNILPVRESEGRLGDPVFDYKMVDDDFLLPIAFFRYLEDIEREVGEVRAFLEQPTGRGESNLEAALRCLEWCVRRVIRDLRFGDHRSLVGLTHPHVGDWRDSEHGLGKGFYSGNINLALVPAMLQSIADLRSRLPIPRHILNDICRRNRFTRLMTFLDRPELLASVRGKWNDILSPFRVSCPPEKLAAAARSYLDSPVWTDEQRSWLRNQPLGLRTVGDFLDGSFLPEEVAEGISFPALSLDRRGEAVPVMNSDIGFQLFFGEPDKAETSGILNLLRLPFPLGLKTPVGILVANPVLADPGLWPLLDRKAYHGLVIWGWQHAMLQKGLLRQARRWRLSGEASLSAELERLAKDIGGLEKGLGRLANSELWSWTIRDGKMLPISFGEESGTETQSNPVQLWSTVHLGVARELDLLEP